MTIHVHLTGGKVLVFDCELHVAIDKMVAALKDNLPNWEQIVITIKR